MNDEIARLQIEKRINDLSELPPFRSPNVVPLKKFRSGEEDKWEGGGDRGEWGAASEIYAVSIKI
jgi:hypothetical protein